MSLETIKRHQLRGDAELARLIRLEIAAGRNTRNPIEVDNLWARCRRCINYRGDHCAELELAQVENIQATGDGDPVEFTFVQLLTRRDLRCRLWPAGSSDRRGLPATSTSEEMVDRMHRQGTARSRPERKAARRSARRGAGTQRK